MRTSRQKGRRERNNTVTVEEFVAIPEQIEKLWPVNTIKKTLQLYTRKVAVQMIET